METAPHLHYSVSFGYSPEHAVPYGPAMSDELAAARRYNFMMFNKAVANTVETEAAHDGFRSPGALGQLAIESLQKSANSLGESVDDVLFRVFNDGAARPERHPGPLPVSRAAGVYALAA